MYKYFKEVDFVCKIILVGLIVVGIIVGFVILNFIIFGVILGLEDLF